MNGIIIKDDARYEYCESYLKNKGHTFNAKEAPGFVIFPFKAAVDELFYDDDFFAALDKGTPVFSGITIPYLVCKSIKHGLDYHAMIDKKAVATKNAVPTSEGVIAYLIANRNETINTSRILVIGYGICGSDLCKRLKAMGANVSALVRNAEKEAAAFTDGIKPLYLPQLKNAVRRGSVSEFDVVINTAPERVLSDEILKQTKGAVLIDIASGPFGFDMKFAKELNEKSANLPGLPGKFAAKTAGEILGDYVDFVLSGGN
jgi:dipicolinate synthase subunit A